MRFSPLISACLFTLIMIFNQNSALAFKIEGLTIVGLINAAQTVSTTSGVTSRTEGLLGFGGGILKDFDFKPRNFSIQSGLLYTKRNYGMSNSYTNSTTWLQVPLLARKNIWIFNLGLGGYLDFALGNLSHDASGTVTTSTISSNMKTFDYGFQGALGTTVFKKIFLDFRYSIGLANLTLGTPNTLTFDEMGLILGYRFN